MEIWIHCWRIATNENFDVEIIFMISNAFIYCIFKNSFIILILIEITYPEIKNNFTDNAIYSQIL